MNGIVEKSWDALGLDGGIPAGRTARIFWWSLFVCWIATVFILSSLSSHQLQPAMLPILGWDKILHATAFGCGSAVFSMALRVSTRLTWRTIILLAVLETSLYGALDEYHQLYTASRSGGDVGDWTADTLGALGGALLIRWFYVRYRKENRGSAPRA